MSASEAKKILEHEREAILGWLIHSDESTRVPDFVRTACAHRAADLENDIRALEMVEVMN